MGSISDIGFQARQTVATFIQDSTFQLTKVDGETRTITFKCGDRYDVTPTDEESMKIRNGYVHRLPL